MALVLVVGFVLGVVPAALAVPQGTLIPLQCRLKGGRWQPCNMRVEQVGGHWWLLIGGQQIEFRHDGRGTVTMQDSKGGWRRVDSRWEKDSSLCWDGVCAKGDIPLD